MLSAMNRDPYNGGTFNQNHPHPHQQQPSSQSSVEAPSNQEGYIMYQAPPYYGYQPGSYAPPPPAPGSAPPSHQHHVPIQDGQYPQYMVSQPFSQSSLPPPPPPQLPPIMNEYSQYSQPTSAHSLPLPSAHFGGPILPPPHNISSQNYGRSNSSGSGYPRLYNYHDQMNLPTSRQSDDSPLGSSSSISGDYSSSGSSPLANSTTRVLTKNGKVNRQGKTKRSRMGCLTCRGRKKRCCERRPFCTECSRLGLKCTWPTPGKEYRNRSKNNKFQLEDRTIVDSPFGKIKVLRGVVSKK